MIQRKELRNNFMKGGETVPIYDNVKKACSEKGISVKALEAKLDFPRGSIYKMNEHSPNILKVQAMAEELGKPIEFFLKGDA